MPYRYRSYEAVREARQKIVNLRGSAVKQDWFRIENSSNSAVPSQVHIYDEIGMFGVSAGEFVADLNSVKGSIDVHLNSPGGEVFDGIAIYNALKNRQGVSVYIDGIAASIASVIAMGADMGHLFIESTGSMMIHDGFAMAAGNAAELTTLAQQLDSVSDTIAGIYAYRTGRSAQQWRADMQKETWYTGQQAVDAGLADGLVAATSPGNRSGVLLNKHDIEHCPSCSEHLVVNAKFCAHCGTKILAAAGATPVGSDGWVCDPDGTMRFDPDGDGDDDSTPEGDKDHDYWTADGKPVPGKTVPPKPDAPDDDEMTDFMISAIRDAAQPHTPMKGSHSHPHPAYGSQGSDSSHDHSHSHDGDAAHSHSHAQAEPDESDATDATNSADDTDDAKKPFPGAAEPFKKGNRFKPAPYARGANEDVECPGCRAFNSMDAKWCDQCGVAIEGREGVLVTKGAGTVLMADVDNSAWDAAKAWHAGTSSDDPGAFYAAICAGKKSGAPNLQSSWALPYRYSPTSPPNAAGVKNALARIDQTQGLTNKEEAQSKLEGLMKKINPDYEPSDSIAELLYSFRTSL